jgi:hypothetical protein
MPFVALHPWRGSLGASWMGGEPKLSDTMVMDTSSPPMPSPIVDDDARRKRALEVDGRLKK